MDTIETKTGFQAVVILSSVMFILSGIDKIQTSGLSDLDRMAKRIPQLDRNTIAYIIILAGIWELVASGGMIWASFDPINRSQIGSLSALSLSLFTILATIIFYLNPLKRIPVLTNLDTVAGLFLIYLIFQKRLIS